MADESKPTTPNGDFDDWFDCGERYLLDDDLEQAVAAFDAALALRPGALAAVGARAAVLTGLGRFEEAIAGFSRMIDEAPDCPAGYLGRAGALAELRKSRVPDALDAAGVAMALADFAAALRLDDEPGGQGVIRFLRGDLLEQIGEFSKAAEDFEAAAKLEPGAAAYLVHLANARFQAGDLDGGTAAMQSVVDMVEPRTKPGRRAIPRRPSSRRRRSRA